MNREEYEAKRQARYERLIAAAEKAEQESAATLDQARKMADIIPFGQPILVGHHSERRDRNYRERIHNKHRRGFELQEKAEYYRRRAEATQNNNAIFSDDPDAVEKIGGKLAQLEARQARMVLVNKLIRKNDRAALEELGYTPAAIEELFKPDFCGRVGYPDYALQNNNANIRRLKKRAQEIEKQQATPDKDEEIGAVRVEWRPSENRIRVYFHGRVDLDTFKALKRHGYRVLSEGEGAFSAYYNNNAAYFVQDLRNKEKEN